MRRREKFLLSSFILSFGLLGTQYVPLDFRIGGISLFFFITYAVSGWALFEDLHGIEWLTVVPFPAFYAISVALFYFLLPEHVLSRVAILALFGVGMYAVYLTTNIYSVAKARTIQLLRAAHAVGLFFSLLITLFISNALFSYHLVFWMNGFGLALLSFPLAYMMVWSIELKQHFSREVFYGAAVIATLLSEFGMILSFFPTSIWIRSLYIVTVFYTCVGVLTTKLAGRLFHNTVWEYVSVYLVMTLIFFWFVQWK